MIVINRPKTPALPYSLHDAHIHKITVKKHRVTLRVPNIYQYQNGTETTHPARISFLDADPDFCDIQIWTLSKKGKLRGREYSLKQFAGKYPHADLEVVTECFHGYSTSLEGYFYHKKKDYHFHIHIFNQGAVRYEIDNP